MKLRIKRGETLKKLKSIRVKLFITLCAVLIVIIVFFVLLNNFMLENFYVYSKQRTLMNVYNKINNFYNQNLDESSVEFELEKIALNNDFDIIVRNKNNLSIYTSNTDFLSSFDNINSILESDGKEVYSDEKINVKQITDSKRSFNFIILTGILDNGNTLYIRLPISPIQESIKIFNNFFYIVGSFAIVAAGIAVLVVSNKFTYPILELNDIAKRMAKLDFSKKYRITDAEDEINDLGNSMNIVSNKLEKTIKELQKTNIELEKDIEEKSRIDEMRKQFISDVSHELKTPIALIQGYAEGLVENVVNDEESKKFYSEVILDEANKMDRLVKQLLELMKLEYVNRKFDNTNFNVVELINEVVKNSKLIHEEQNIKIEINSKDEIIVNADDFYIEQVLTNYFTNAIKHVQEVNGKKLIRITVEERESKIRIIVFNTGKNIDEENLSRIWNRFYKVDASRNREDGGTGIGLSLVKAIMNNYGNDYGVENREDGVEFYFELDKEKKE